MMVVGPSRQCTPLARHSLPSATSTRSSKPVSKDAARAVAHGKQAAGAALVPAQRLGYLHHDRRELTCCTSYSILHLVSLSGNVPGRELTGPSDIWDASTTIQYHRRGLNRTFGSSSRDMGAVCHMSSPLRSFAFSSLVSFFRISTGLIAVMEAAISWTEVWNIERQGV